MMNKKSPINHIFHKRRFIQGSDLVETIQQSLPKDIQRYIYLSYLWFEAEKKPICDDLLAWFSLNQDVQNLHVSEGVFDKKIKIVENLLTCSTCVDYLCKQDEDFKRCYQSHFTEKKKGFVLMTKTKSFITSIIMYKHH